MTKLESDIELVLQHLQSKLECQTWESRRRYFKQMLKLAGMLNITEPCSALFDAFIADDRGSEERRSMHIRCVKLLDAAAHTNAKDERGVLYNEQPLPDETAVEEFFQHHGFPLKNQVDIDYLIIKAGIEMRHLSLSSSTMGQYQQAWVGIRRYCISHGITVYDNELIHKFLHEINLQRNNGTMNEWKWKINRKAAYVLIEVARTGFFHWGLIQQVVTYGNPHLEDIHIQFRNLLVQRNLSDSTINLNDYVFRRTFAFCGISSPEDLFQLSPDQVQLSIGKFSSICCQRSMATILPILRSMIGIFYAQGWIEKDLSGIVMSGFVQRGSVAAYISTKDEEELIMQLDKEPKRSKAIVLIALRLGLRDCDICNLTLREIDWTHDRICLMQKKTGEPLVLPLLPDVGNALMDYITTERPQRQDNYPYVFLRQKAPHIKMTSVYTMCAKLLAKLNIRPVNGTGHGMHLFRYSMVHKLLAAKVPHQVITDTLGHTSIESDKPYLSMEDSMLKLCALDLSVIGGISWKVKAHE
ncbi:tyrosine-type recombinase/integrase [bacterium]|nr:tyrosine-type recombinase/integrase [candidate division CSSED10-310 bacterium]